MHQLEHLGSRGGFSTVLTSQPVVMFNPIHEFDSFNAQETQDSMEIRDVIKLICMQLARLAHSLRFKVSTIYM